MAKKKDKKDKEAKKARMAEKNAKSQAKSESKNKKMAKKTGEDDDDVAIEDILANYAKEQEQFEAITITPCDPPSKRVNPSMVASPVHGRKELLLFGGESQNGSLAVFYNELYSYTVDTDQWRLIASRNSPLPRSGHTMCVHPSGIILMFGGEFSSPKQNTFYHYGDTWVLDPQKKEWQKIDQKKGPSARSGHRMTYWKNYVLLHGGFRDLATSTTYLNDLWAFDVTSYKWHQIEFPPTNIIPDARSGHSFMPHSEGGVIWGGYSKVKASKGQQKGKVHQDTWLLKMKSDLKGCRWERRKKTGFAPSPRVGCSMVYHKGRGLLFGGVYDTDETEESLESDFYNSLFAYQTEMNRWFSLTLRTSKKKKDTSSAPIKYDRDEDLEANLSAILRNSGLEDDEAEDEKAKEQTPEPESESDLGGSDAKQVKNYPVVNALPHPRFNATTAVVDDTLFIYGGIFEQGDNEYMLDSFYSIDLNRLEGMKVLWENLKALEEAQQNNLDSEDEDDDDEEEDDDDEDEDEENDEEDDGDQKGAEEDEEEDEEPEAEPEVSPDPRPWLPHPKPFENMRQFYIRAGPQFLEWALSNNRDARGKDLKRIAFELSEERWWERREEVRVAEDQFEEMGGVGEVIERDASAAPRTKARR